MLRLEDTTRILDQHGIRNVVNGNHRVIAEEVFRVDGRMFTELVDVTDFGITELKAWLGY